MNAKSFGDEMPASFPPWRLVKRPDRFLNAFDRVSKGMGSIDHETEKTQDSKDS
jgi:hypothetical protein